MFPDMYITYGMLLHVCTICTFYGCKMGMGGLPDMSTLSPQVLWPKG